VTSAIDRFATDFRSVMEADGGGDRSVAQVTVHPRSIEGVVDVVRRAASDGLSVLVVGSGSATGPGGAKVDIALVTDMLTGVIVHEPADLTLVVRAGATLGDVDDLLAAHAQTAVLPEEFPSRSVGGVVSAGDSGFRRLRYGPTRDRVLGVTVVTGYGEVVVGGGRLVKNVTGFDLPRLVTGARGAIGVVVDVCLKLWPQPAIRMTIPVEDIDTAWRSVHRPAAALETGTDRLVYIEGSESSVDETMSLLGGAASEGHRWPEPIRQPCALSVRVPPSAIQAGIAIVRSHGAEGFIAQHGVGLIEAGWSMMEVDELRDLREGIAALGGVAVVDRWPNTGAPERWGMVPSGIDIQRKLKQQFDPMGVLNVGHLPGGV
jgi:glycolate oxidase FAD binding subunit